MADTRKQKQRLSVRFVGKYRLFEKIGRGASGVVRRCKHVDTKQTCAAKVVARKLKDGAKNTQLCAEIAALARVSDHPNIVTLLSVIELGSKMYLFMDLCDETLACWLTRAELATDHEAKHIMHCLLSALEFCHSHSVVHRDVKLENVLLCSGHVRLADFGLSCIADRALTTRVGTPLYVAPEVFGALDGYDHKVDVWSLGVLGFCLLSGKPPFAACSGEHGRMVSLFTNILTEEPQFEEALFSVGASAFLAQCLQKKPRNRPGPTELLEHDWVRDSTVLSWPPKQRTWCTLDDGRAFVPTCDTPVESNRRHSINVLCAPQRDPRLWRLRKFHLGEMALAKCIPAQ